jgi:hypothetical protein
LGKCLWKQHRKTYSKQNTMKLELKPFLV